MTAKMRKAAQTVIDLLEIGDQRLLAADGPAGGQKPDLSPEEWGKVYRACKVIAREAPPAEAVPPQRYLIEAVLEGRVGDEYAMLEVDADPEGDWVKWEDIAGQPGLNLEAAKDVAMKATLCAQIMLQNPVVLANEKARHICTDTRDAANAFLAAHPAK